MLFNPPINTFRKFLAAIWEKLDPFKYLVILMLVQECVRSLLEFAQMCEYTPIDLRPLFHSLATHHLHTDGY